MSALKEEVDKAKRKKEKNKKKYNEQSELCEQMKIKLQLMVEMKNGYDNVTQKEKKNNESIIKEEILSEHKKIVKLTKKVEKDIDSLNQSLLKNVFLYI